MKFLITSSALIFGTIAFAIKWNEVSAPVNALTLVMAFFALWVVFAWLASVDNHMTNLADLKAADVKIATAEQSLKDVQALAADKHGLPDSLMALKQDDNPVTKYMSLVDYAIDRVRDAKNRKADSESNIAARAAGPFGMVVTMLGSSV